MEDNIFQINHAGYAESTNAEDKHQKIINSQIEKAKDPNTYETYNYHTSEADEKIKLFAARRRGTKHVTDNIPCQDYCLTTSVNGYTVLADADGVSSCAHSDIGSRLACESVVSAVKSATEKCNSEDQFVNRIMSVTFRERLVSIWVNLVMEEINKSACGEQVDTMEEFSKYGSTLMFAVISENWIIVGNLGDGQVLVFNNSYGVKLRVHAPKDSSKVRCLVNEKCAREDFQIAKYPRRHFNGVLLTTDGIYESLDKNVHLYNYAIQMKQRFLQHDPCEPYQAFCYKEDGEPYKDFSVMRTQDDCSIALAIDETEVDSDYNEILDYILKHSSAALFRRWDANCLSFFAKTDIAYFDVLVTSKQVNLEIDSLKTAILDKSDEVWEEKGYRFSKYSYVNAPTLEFMYCSGELRRDRHNPIESEQKVLKVFTMAKALQKELDELGYMLNSSAVFNILFDGNDLIVRPEAITKKEDINDTTDNKAIDRFFSNMIGLISSKEGARPMFDIGYLDRGLIHYTILNEKTEKLCRIVRVDNTLRIKNISAYAWNLDDGSIVEPDETVDSRRQFSFEILNSEGKKQEEFEYIPRELI